MKHIEVDYWTGIKETYKWITIEGIGQRASMDEICHKLQYMGHIIENPVENVWKIEDDDDDYLENVKNGDVSVRMVLDYEVNYLVSGMTAFRVKYQGQAKQCGYCFSWKHSFVRDCPKKKQGLGRQKLLKSYYENWKKEVNYRKRPVLDVTVEETVKIMSENENEEESGELSENEFLEEIDGEDKCTEELEDEEYNSVGNREEQEEEDEDEKEEVGEAREGEDADDDDEDGGEEKSSRAGATTVDLQEVTGDVSNVGVDEDVTGESDYSEGVKRMDMDQQEMKERSMLDRTGVG